MRSHLLGLLALPLVVPSTPATGWVTASDDPLICVRTGEVYAGPYSYDPPDPCVL